MKKYRMNLTAMGLSRGDTFTTEEDWDSHVKKGILSLVEDDGAEPAEKPDLSLVPDTDQGDSPDEEQPDVADLD